MRIPRLLAAALALAASVCTRPAGAVIPVSITPQSSLSFGQIVATGSAGTVTVLPTGGRSRTGGVVLANAFGTAAASFAVTGEPYAAYSITLPSSATLSAGGSSMTVVQFTSLSAGGADSLGPSGAQSVAVGATLQVGSGQAAAAYSGSYDITLAYP